jgi:hypothetical protein
MYPTPYVASLRVFEPLEAFDPVDRLRWQNLDANHNSREEEQRLALERIIFPQPPSARPDGVHILDLDGARYISPWSTATRCWAALESFKGQFPPPLSHFFISPALEEVITSGMDFIDERVPHTLSETWIIPPRWFSIFTPNEREIGSDQHGPFSKARTTIAQAKARTKRAHETVEGAFGVGPVEEEIENLLEWLEIFHPESLVELDYGGLAGYLSAALTADGEEGLVADTSIEDVLLSLDGLAQGDGQIAGGGYERLVRRWRAVQAFETSI